MQSLTGFCRSIWQLSVTSRVFGIGLIQNPHNFFFNFQEQFSSAQSNKTCAMQTRASSRRISWKCNCCLQIKTQGVHLCFKALLPLQARSTSCIWCSTITSCTSWRTCTALREPTTFWGPSRENKSNVSTGREFRKERERQREREREREREKVPRHKQGTPGVQREKGWMWMKNSSIQRKLIVMDK